MNPHLYERGEPVCRNALLSLDDVGIGIDALLVCAFAGQQKCAQKVAALDDGATQSRTQIRIARRELKNAPGLTLKARRSELSDQLISATNRRQQTAKQLQSASGANRAGLEQRLGVLDARIARLEQDIAETGELLSSPSYASVAQKETSPYPTIAMNAVPILIVFTLFVLCPIALAFACSIWKRGSQPRPVADGDTTARLQRMEQAMDAIAIEIERVSEGQRFVTRLMAEGKGAIPIPAVSAEREEKVRG